MNKRKVWQDLYQETFPNSNGIPVYRVSGMIKQYNPDDIVTIDNDKDNNETTIYIGRWRDETDEEVQARSKEAERIKINAEKLSGSNMVVLHTKEYEELKREGMEV